MTPALESSWDGAEEIVPGTRPRRVHGKERLDWRRTRPRSYMVGGSVAQYYPVSVLAEALGRKTETVLSWERKHWFPTARRRGPRTDDIPGHRLYSPEFVEGVLAIWKDEGLDHPRAPSIRQTRFTERVFKLMEELGE